MTQDFNYRFFVVDLQSGAFRVPLRSSSSCSSPRWSLSEFVDGPEPAGDDGAGVRADAIDTFEVLTRRFGAVVAVAEDATLKLVERESGS